MLDLPPSLTASLTCLTASILLLCEDSGQMVHTYIVRKTCSVLELLRSCTMTIKFMVVDRHQISDQISPFSI